MPNFKKSFSTNFQDDDDLKDEIFNKINKDLAYQKALNMKQEVAYNLCKIENNQIRQSRIEYCLHFERNFWLQNYMEAKNKLINLDKKLLGETVNESLNITLNTSDSGYGISEFDDKESGSAVEIELNENNRQSLKIETELSKKTKEDALRIIDNQTKSSFKLWFHFALIFIFSFLLVEVCLNKN